MLKTLLLECYKVNKYAVKVGGLAVEKATKLSRCPAR